MQFQVCSLFMFSSIYYIFLLSFAIPSLFTVYVQQYLVHFLLSFAKHFDKKGHQWHSWRGLLRSIQKPPTPRGVNSAKLQDIIAKIGPLMQPSRFQFYQDLLSSDLGDMISNQWTSSSSSTFPSRSFVLFVYLRFICLFWTCWTDWLEPGS